MSVGRYALVVAVVTGGSLGLAWAMLAARLSAAQWQAAVLGGLLAAVNTVAAYALVTWSAGRSTQAFMGAVLGGMLARMALMLAAVTTAALRFDLPVAALAVSLLGYFVAFLAFELTVLPRRQGRRAA